jgi:hypothetical protein
MPSVASRVSVSVVLRESTSISPEVNAVKRSFAVRLVNLTQNRVDQNDCGSDRTTAT